MSERRLRVLNLGSCDWSLTQSLYHAVAEAITEGSSDTLILCRPAQPYLCLGYHQPCDAVLDRDACRQMGLPIYRRRLGGGATYLDRNQIFYQCILHHSRAPAMIQDLYAKTLAAPVQALRRLGLKASLRDLNEIEVRGRRIAGTGGGRIGEACVVVGNLLFDFDYSAMSRAWRVPWESFRRLAAEALPRSLVTLQELGVGATFCQVEEILIEEFQRALQATLRAGQPNGQELFLAEAATRDHTSEACLRLHGDAEAAPMNSLKIAAGVWVRAVRVPTPAGELRASVLVRDEVIEECVLESSAPGSGCELERAARGKNFHLWQQIPASAV